MSVATSSPSSGYIPATPFSASADCALSRDLIATSEIVVDLPPQQLLNGSPIGPFTNPANSQLEALVLTTPQGGSSSQLAHVQRTSESESGWKLAPLSPAIVANEVCAGRAMNHSIYGFYQDGTAFWATQLSSDGVTWSAPEQLDTNVVSNLRVCYTQMGSLIVYGNDAKGNLVITSKDSNGNTIGPMSFTIQGLSLVSGDYALTMTSQTEFQLMANSNGTAYWVQGDTSAGVQSVVKMSNFNLTVSRIIMGFWNADPNVNAIMFMLVDSDQQLHYTTGTSADGAVVPITNSNVASAVGYAQASDGTLHLYSLDVDNNLSVTHQTGWSGTTPSWAPVIPLDTGIIALAADVYPADAPAFFALDGNAFLRLHQQQSKQQSPSVQYWRSGPVHQPGAEVFDTVRWRTEILLTDANGAPLPGVAMTASLATLPAPPAGQPAPVNPATDIVVAGKTYTVGPGQNATLTTDAMGRITFATLVTSGLSASTLQFTADGLPQPLQICPAQPLHVYLNGQGPLNPGNPGGGLPPLDCEGTTLANAQTVDPNTGAPTGTFAPGAAGSSAMAAAASIAIRNAAQISLSVMPNAPSPSATCPTPQMIADVALDDITSSIESFFGDVWEGIKNGIITISGYVVDVVNDVVTLTMKVVNGIEGAAKLILNDIESVGRFIAGVVQTIGADFKKLVDWLKALFDFAAIWRTKMAIQSALAALAPWVQNALTVSRKGVDGWFSQQESAVQNYFDNWGSNGFPSTFGGINGWQDPGGGSNNTGSIGGSSVTVKSATNNVHHNWAQDKMNTYSSSNPLSGQNGGSWGGINKKINDSTGQAFVNALDELGKALNTLFTGVLTGSVPMGSFMQQVGAAVVDLLKFADDVVDDIFTLAGEVVTLMCEQFGAPISLGFINTLWSWIAKAAGYPEDSELSFAALASLLVAFPTTVIYKIINDNAEPFPAQGLPPQWGCTDAAAIALSATVSAQNQKVSALIQILYTLFAIPTIMAAESKPWWIASIGIGMSISIWVFWNGLPQMPSLQWSPDFTEAVGPLLVVLPVVVIVMTASLSVSAATLTVASSVVISLVGLLMLIAGIVNLVKSGSSDGAWAKVLMPIPTAMNFLQTPALNTNPWAKGLSILFAVLGYFVGGDLEYNSVS